MPAIDYATHTLHPNATRGLKAFGIPGLSDRDFGLLNDLLDRGINPPMPLRDEEPPVCWSIHWCDVDGSNRGEFTPLIIDPQAGAGQDGAEAVAAWMNKRHPDRYHYAASTRLSRIELP